MDMSQQSEHVCNQCIPGCWQWYIERATGFFYFLTMHPHLVLVCSVYLERHILCSGSSLQWYYEVAACFHRHTIIQIVVSLASLKLLPMVHHMELLTNMLSKHHWREHTRIHTHTKTTNTLLSGRAAGYSRFSDCCKTYHFIIISIINVTFGDLWWKESTCSIGMCSNSVCLYWNRYTMLM